jgi:hypothetical protein
LRHQQISPTDSSALARSAVDVVALMVTIVMIDVLTAVMSV